MKKQLMISLNDNNYEIQCKEKKIIISKNILTVSGEDIFNNIFSDVNFDEILEIEYFEDEKTIIDSADKRIVKDIKSIIESIKDKITEAIANKINTK